MNLKNIYIFLKQPHEHGFNLAFTKIHLKPSSGVPIRPCKFEPCKPNPLGGDSKLTNKQIMNLARCAPLGKRKKCTWNLNAYTTVSSSFLVVTHGCLKIH